MDAWRKLAGTAQGGPPWQLLGSGAWRDFFSSLRELVHGRSKIGFQRFNGLLAAFGKLLVAGVGVADGSLEDGYGVFRTGRGVFAHFFHQRDDLAIGFSDLRFSCFAEFSLGARSDGGQVTAVGDGFLGAWLGLGGRQREEFLWVFGRQQLLGGGSRFFQRRLGSGQVQFDDFFNAFEGLAGQRREQGELGFQVGFGGGRKLLRD